MLDYIPEPTILLMGNAAWPLRPEPGGACPACGTGVRAGHDRVFCLVCDEGSPAFEARVRAARIGVKARGRAEDAERRAKEQLDGAMKRLRKGGAPILSERQRRWIWNGQTGGILKERPDVTNAAAVGRAWLISIGQAPDFSIVLGHRGRVLRRVELDGERPDDGDEP